ncbi:hypothetical protein M9H77_27504 [Catharanthus roseus]|uniref:Uncharacterized protein n=1 Tax=Catharanthus roseus TaxID=4058 RepID=A0ACC0AGU4_CATRO|nr:hypothetical protein M9H77_27504 [Catharanthus roseus]
MEEVPAHVHPGPIVPDILTRQHEHRSGLIWSGDHETCITNLQCRRFGRNLFQSYSTAPCRECTTDRGSPCPSSDLGLVAYSCIAALATPFVWLPDHDHSLVKSDMWRAENTIERNDHTYWGTHHASHLEVWYQWRQHIRDGTVLPVEELSNPRDDYIRWNRDITRVYISNPANRDTRTIGYQPAEEVDDIATGVIQGLPSSQTQIASFAKKVQTIIRRCMIQQQTVSSTHAKNTINMMEHVTVITQMVFHEPSMLYTTINDEDEEIESSHSESDDNNAAEEEELQTHIIPVTENTVTQWESS